jgi:hypothetical protein
MKKGEILSADQKVEGIREPLAISSILPIHEESLFLRQNDYRIIRYHGHTAFLKSSRGLDCLAVLLRTSGHEFHVRELLARPHLTGGLYAGVPALDAQAKAKYKCRINELRQDLNEADRFNDPQRKAAAQNELHAIVDYLASAVGLGGKDRKISSDAERARSAVTKCIRKAIQKIDHEIPSLGSHLTARIKTGYFCSYNPHPERPVNWKF